MTLYPPVAVERMMKVQEVILRAMSGELTWIQAAWILGVSDRTMRRWKARYEKYGYDGLYDRRRGRPSPKRVPMHEVERILRLYRERYPGFNVRHFHQTIQREHGVTLSYTFVKKALQQAGLVKKKRSRGRHRLRRERKPCFGEMLHIDGSAHRWLALSPEQELVMISVVDDATSRLLYAQLWDEESTRVIFIVLKAVFEQYGLPMSVYSDRASWAFYTPKAGGKVDKDNPTQVGRALERLGIEHIPSYSPQARGRSERMNRTLQDRVVNELRAAGISDVDTANRYLRERYIPVHNELFCVPAREPQSMFVGVRGVDLDQILCEEQKRVVGQDNVVRYKNRALQITKQRNRSTCAGRHVVVREHVDGRLSIWLGPTCLGIYDCKDQALEAKKRTVRDVA